MNPLETRIAALTVAQIIDVLRGLVTDTSDEAARVTTACLARLYRTMPEADYCKLCDELYGAWG
jgi:hypothetical protein